MQIVQPRNRLGKETPRLLYLVDQVYKSLAPIVVLVPNVPFDLACICGAEYFPWPLRKAQSNAFVKCV